MRILMVEDEIYLAKAIAEILKRNHYSIDLASDGCFGLDCALSGIYDIIILDIMLPGMDGFCVLREIRNHGITVPVILLTARSNIEDRVQGLDLGADDYLPKPFHTDELLARLRALSRRKPDLAQNGSLCFGQTILSPHTLMLEYGSEEIKLTLKEAQLLELLIQNKNQIISKDTMIEKVWGYDSNAEDNHVESHISLLRKKMSQINTDSKIVTIRNAGYILQKGNESGV
jgi:DNA-binding response OmpR family regulator